MPTQDAPFDVLKEKAIKQMEKAEEKRKAKKAPKEELPPISSYVASNSDFIRQLITTLHKLTRTSSENRNFFWDAFVWEDIDSHLKGSDTTC